VSINIAFSMPNDKHQIPNNIQIQRSKVQNVWRLVLGAWDLFEICYLVFGISSITSPCSPA
jgi:hypothetical protein